MKRFAGSVALCCLLLISLLSACRSAAQPDPSPPEGETTPPPVSAPIESLSPEAPTDPAPPEPSAADLAETVWQTILGGECYFMAITDRTDNTSVDLQCSTDRAWGMPKNTAEYEWSFAEPTVCDDTCDHSLSLSVYSASGDALLNFYPRSDCGRILLRCDGQPDRECRASSAQCDPLSARILKSAESRLLQQNSNITVNTFSDYEQVLRQYAEQYVSLLSALPGWSSYHVDTILLRESGVTDAYYGEEYQNFWGSFTLYFSPDTADSDWLLYPFTTEITEGEYTGWYKHFNSVHMVRGEDGEWYWYEGGTGGEICLPKSDGNNEATIEELIRYFDLSSGTSRWNFIPQIITRRPLSAVEELNRLLPREHTAGEQCLCWHLGRFLYGCRDNTARLGVQLTYEILLDALDPVHLPCLKAGYTSDPDYTDLAQSVYTSIVGEQGSRDCSVEVFDPADGSTTHIHLTEENIWNLPDIVGKYPPPSSSGAVAYQWTPAEPCSCTDPLTLTLRSPDGTASLTCHKGCANVTLTTEGTQYLLSAEASDGWTLFNSLLGAVDDALVFIPMTSFLVDGSVTDYEAVVEEYARQYGDYLNALPDWLPSKPETTVYSGSRVSQAYFGEGTENFCAGFGFYLSSEMGGSDWEAGTGLMEPTDEAYAGWWSWGTGADFARNEDGDWYCTGTYTGGEWLRYPTRLEDSTLEQMVYYFYHTTPGHAHDYLIPYYICRSDVSALPELNEALNGLDDPAPFCTALGRFLRDYGSYTDLQLTFDVLSQGLDAPFAAWLKEGYAAAE